MQEVLELPEWERSAWRSLFELVGPLDWKRSDILMARVNQYQAAGQEPLKSFILFKDPTEREKQSEEEILAALGFKEDVVANG